MGGRGDCEEDIGEKGRQMICVLISCGEMGRLIKVRP